MNKISQKGFKNVWIRPKEFLIFWANFSLEAYMFLIKKTYTSDRFYASETNEKNRLEK